MRFEGGIIAIVTVGLLGLWSCSEPSVEPPPQSVEPPPTDDSTGEEPVAETTAAEVAEPVSLMHAESWELADAADDPFAAERPQWVQCEVGWEVVTGVFVVDTSLCTYAAFVQPTTAAIQAGDRVELSIGHGPLMADEPGITHLGIAFGPEIAWETEIAVPAEAGTVTTMWIAPEEVPAGTPLHLHMHDHGSTFRFNHLTVAGR